MLLDSEVNSLCYLKSTLRDICDILQGIRFDLREFLDNPFST